MRQVILCPGDDGFFVAEFPRLPGCISQGGDARSRDFTHQKAIALYVETLQEDSLPVPEEKYFFNSIFYK